MVVNLSETEAAYLAGIVDGEGSLTISMGVSHGTVNIVPEISIANNKYALMQWLLDRVSGSVYGRIHKGNQATSYTWKCTNSLRVPLLQRLLPYLLLKQRQAEIVIEIADQIRANSYRGKRLPDEALLQRLQLVSEIRTLNKRGA